MPPASAMARMWKAGFDCCAVSEAARMSTKRGRARRERSSLAGRCGTVDSGVGKMPVARNGAGAILSKQYIGKSCGGW